MEKKKQSLHAFRTHKLRQAYSRKDNILRVSVGVVIDIRVIV